MQCLTTALAILEDGGNLHLIGDHGGYQFAYATFTRHIQPTFGQCTYLPMYGVIFVSQEPPASSFISGSGHRTAIMRLLYIELWYAESPA